MNSIRRILVLLAAGAVLAPVPGIAQQGTGKMARVGWVSFSPRAEAPPRASAMEGFRSGMRELGWIEGKNFLLDIRVGDRPDAAGFAKEFIAKGTDVIFADGAMVGTLRSQGGTVPIVFTMSGDPVEAKWIASLARPGGNITGMSSLQLELE